MQRWWYSDEKSKDARENLPPNPKKINNQQKVDADFKEIRFKVFLDKDLNSHGECRSPWLRSFIKFVCL